MTLRRAILLGFCVVLVGVLAVQAWRWRQPFTRTPSPADQAVSIMVEKAYEDINAIKQSGGYPGAMDAVHKKWADKAWSYREEHPRTHDAEIATVFALEMLTGMSTRDELLARMATLSADEEATSFVLRMLYLRAESNQDLPGFIAFAQDLRAKRDGSQPEDATMRSRLDYQIGLAYDALEDPVEARASFDHAIEEAPSSLWAKNARTGIYELDYLSSGQPAPLFAGTDLNGKPFSLEDLRGVTVLLHFWGWGQQPFEAEFPRLRKLQQQYGPRGLLIVGIPLNGSRKELERIAHDHILTWPQVFDGKDGEKTVKSLYNVDSVPDHYLIDREGKIVVRHLREKDLEQQIAALLNE